MSNRLRDALKRYLIEQGNMGITKLAVALERHPRTIARWVESGRVPSQHDAYVLGKALGLSEEEALSLAEETSPSRKAKTA